VGRHSPDKAGIEITSDPQTSDDWRRRRLVPALALIFLIAVAYWPAVHGGFLFDDDTILTNNPLVHAADGLQRIWLTTQAIDYWPVTNTSFWLEWRLWGLNPVGYHVTNVVLHACSALLLWAILRQVGVPGSFWGAALFALHPVNVQSVAWIAQRKNTLAMFWCLLSIAAFLKTQRVSRSATPTSRRQPTRSDKFYWLSLAAFVLAMLSKGSVAVVPAVFMILLWWRNGVVTRRDLLRVMPFVVVAVVFTFVNVSLQSRAGGAIRDVLPAGRLLGAAAVVWFYLSKALVPVGLTFMYPQWTIEPNSVLWWLPLIAAAALSMLLWTWRGRPMVRGLLVAWALFCTALLPVMGLTDVYFMKYSLVADHYQYFAVIALTSCVGAGLARGRLAIGTSRVNASAAIGVCLVAALGILTWRQARLYADAETLYRATLEANPDAWALRNNLGALLVDRGQDADGAAELRESLRQNPDLTAARVNLCLADIHVKAFEMAVRECADAAHDAPSDGRVHAHLALSLMALGRLGEAEAEFKVALAREPGNADARYNFAHLLAITGRAEESVTQYREVLRVLPDSAVAHNELGVALASTGDNGDAEREFRAALALRPDFAEARRNLDELLRHIGR
jgi:tetratricopeptide (TPR) repeat protein